MNELDEAQLKADMRALYRDVGSLAAFRALYELLISANLLLEVIHEEKSKERLDS